MRDSKKRLKGGFTMDLNKKVKVWNRNGANTVYYIDELRMLREFAPAGRHGDVLMIPISELQALSYIQGGHTLLTQHLLIKEQEVCEFLGVPVEPEYYYGVEEVKTLLKEGTLEQLMDCLEFAPSGVKDLLVKYAVDEKVDSYEKRDLITKATGVNITARIKNNELSGPESEGVEEKVGTSSRRAAPIQTKESATPVNKYKVVEKK